MHKAISNEERIGTPYLMKYAKNTLVNGSNIRITHQLKLTPSAVNAFGGCYIGTCLNIFETSSEQVQIGINRDVIQLVEHVQNAAYA